MALGATRLNILLQFLIESILLCLLGGILGIALGVGMAELLSRTAGWVMNVSPESVLLAFTFSISVGLFFGILPARRAAKLDPIDALRYE
jgi:putative ABC transport system permease protein